MDQRIFHGDFQPDTFANALIGEFNRGNLRAQKLGDEDEIIVQIATKEYARSGGDTAMTIKLQKVEDGISVQIGKQTWLGIAASLGQTALSVWKNPFRLIERLDDLAQDIESLQLSDRVWNVLENTSRVLGATYELSDRLRRTVCAYCKVANPVGEASCLACGAPLGEMQPRTCPQCGYVVTLEEALCPNCGNKIKTE